jgi:ankyrin repeat protein
MPLIALLAWASDDAPSHDLLDAAARGDGPRLTALLAGGADPEVRDGEGRPALLLAVASGQEKAVEALLRGGARPDPTTGSGWTPLHEAARKGVLEPARALLDAGAGPDLRDRLHGTPLDVAEQGGHERLARLLRANGARGSGKSIGDTVCVRSWSGDGFCGVVLARDPTRHRLRVTEVKGCSSGCEPRPACSAGRTVGPGGLGEGDTLWVPASCLTHTGLR